MLVPKFQCDENEAGESQYGDNKKESQSGSGTMSASEPDLTQQVNINLNALRSRVHTY